MDAPDPFYDRWTTALTELELDVADAEAMLHGDHLPPATPWEPPENLGPLPLSLRDRAQRLVERQQEVAQRLAEALVLSRQQARLNESLKTAGPANPVYVDTSG